MIPICELEITDLFLYRDQSYYGRVLIALREHGKEIADLTAEEGAAFMRDLGKAGRAVQAVVNPAKINYGMFSDKLAHLHCHIVPKQADGPDFGGMFQMSCNPPAYLSEGEYAELIGKIKENLK
jgi:Diadenosine tetraphosphate (Ap4A) hydrolase and other HIT family hydrolases